MLYVRYISIHLGGKIKLIKLIWIEEKRKEKEMYCPAFPPFGSLERGGLVHSSWEGIPAGGEEEDVVKASSSQVARTPCLAGWLPERLRWLGEGERCLCESRCPPRCSPAAKPREDGQAWEGLPPSAITCREARTKASPLFSLEVCF